MTTKFPQVVTKTLLSTEDQVICAETLQALHFVQCNYSFGSNKVSNVFKQMFPDSKTAQSYKQEETKIKYVIQFGIASFVKEQIIGDCKLQSFSVKRDGTNTSRVKEQYDGYVHFWSSLKKEIVSKLLNYYQMPNCC